MTYIFLLAALVASTLARPQPQAYSHPAPVPALAHGPSYSRPAPAPVGPAQYDFNYVVRDNVGNDFGHQEARDGYNTQGSYSVLLPDGRLQKVTYYVDGDSGYVAEVTYEGEAKYPAYHPAPAPSYRPAPTPSYTPAPSYG
ncbi:Pro-resilin-like 66 [Homarus americanus]|uniref:Pro-resilin-like 66 n=1 Tax=Homarus americanus TaxID=6706 RepID=A0A8J5MPP5_HOMAM|nr:Pro-resilin-like 66 [Homarus americanus]